MSQDQECSNVRIWTVPNQSDAGFVLVVNVVDDRGTPLATIGSCKVSEPEHLRAILHAYRMGQRFSPDQIVS